MTHVVVATACSRPENLWAIRNSIVTALFEAPEVSATWWVSYDIRAITDWRVPLGAPALRVNGELMSVEGPHPYAELWQPALDYARTLGNPWFCLLDDDNTMEPEFLRAIDEYSGDRGVKAIFFAQRRGKVVAPPNVEVGGIDTGQGVARVSVMPEKIENRGHETDGYLWSGVRAGLADDEVVFDSRPLVTWNTLR